MSKAGFTFKVVKRLNGKKLDELRRHVSSMNRQVNVGFPANGKTEENGVPLAMVAAVHNFGSPEQGIPERPFLVRAIKSHLQDYKDLNSKTLPLVIAGRMSVERALGLLGEMAKGHIQLEITNGDFVPLKPETIRRKGSSVPLIDDGQMRQGVAWELAEK